MLHKKIDIVYLWVDGSDNKWLEKKRYWQKHLQNKKNNEEYDWAQGVQQRRFSDNGELKFSLRSISLYAKWINNIYIVTDSQVPKWLDIYHPKINIIDHTVIIPKDKLPNFNSIAIEHFINNIPKLSEYYLIANDDYFFYKKTPKSFFYTLTGRPKYRPFSRYYDSKNIEQKSYVRSVANAYNAVYKETGKKYYYSVSHNMCPLRKSIVEKAYNVFKSQIDVCTNHKFRSFRDTHFTIYAQYACAINKGKLFLENLSLKDRLYFRFGLIRNSYQLYIKIKKLPKHFSISSKNTLPPPSDRSSFNKQSLPNSKQAVRQKTFCADFLNKININISELQQPKTLEVLKISNPYLFCVNEFLPEYRQKLINELIYMYPEKSEFEK